MLSQPSCRCDKIAGEAEGLHEPFLTPAINNILEVDKMKLPIKKKYFDQIKSGEKILEFRDAHITFVCEETGETLRKDVFEVDMKRTEDIEDLSEEEAKELFDDEWVMVFSLQEEE